MGKKKEKEEKFVVYLAGNTGHGTVSVHKIKFLWEASANRLFSFWDIQVGLIKLERETMFCKKRKE